MDLIDRIYECSFAPELWPAVLDELALIAEARGGHLFTANQRMLSWTASETLRDGLQRVAEEDWVRRGQRVSRMIAAQHAGFLTEQDIYTDAELAEEPWYRDLLWPAGLGWAAGFALPLPTGDVLLCGLERVRERGPVEPDIIRRLDGLRPHLARSALLSARLQLEAARVASETLARIGLPALVLDGRGRVLAANHLIETLGGHLRWRAFDRLSLSDRFADGQLKAGIAALEQGEAAICSFALRGANDQAVLVAHVIPVRGVACDVFVRCTAILVLTPVSLPNAPPVTLIQSLFDLTPAEARVARHLVEGATVGEISVADKVSSNTVRSQVRGVLEKTGCRRQTEIVALLGGIAFPR